MLDALLRADPGDGSITLTVRVEGRRKLHETFRLKTWNGRDLVGKGYLFVSVPGTADWSAGVKPVTPLTLDLESGELIPNRRDPRVTPLLARLARIAFDYAATGRTASPGNAKVEVMESLNCGACGRKLTDDVSIELGIGPDCEERLYGKTTPRSRTARSST
jgi:hypothetical protein